MFSAKKPALRRMWIIDSELRKKKFPTLRDLAEKADATEKTIQRDIQSMKDDHKAPVAYDARRKGWGYTGETYRLPAVIITEGELVAMFLAGQALRQVQGTPYAADLQRAIQKLSEFLPDEVSLHWQVLEQTQSFHQTVTNLQDIELFRQLADATLHHRRIKIRYWTASRNTEAERIVDPYHLACIDGTWYLMAWCHERKETRTFATNRVREIQQTKDTFDPPQDFQIGDCFEGAFKVISQKGSPLQTIRLKFAPSAAKYVREKLVHSSQVIELHDDQSVTLTVALRSLVEVRRWVLSWGSECEVLEPEELKVDIRREAQRMLTETPASDVESNGSMTTALEKIRKNLKSKPQQRGKRTG